jgi:carbohydrate diacid regulator
MSILGPALAQKFIDKTAKHLEYNINIMNDKGIIIASKDASRVGSFHEVAYGMLNGTIETGIVTEKEKYIGTKPGVNLFIDYKNKHVGVICVTGNPENVHAFAVLVKTSMEAMLEYELQMEGERRRKDKAEHFLYYLLYEDRNDSAVVDRMSDELGLNKELYRICILIKYHSDYSAAKLIQALTSAEGHSVQDVIAVARNNDIILLKALGDKKSDTVKGYKLVIEEYIKNALEKLPTEYEPKKISFFIGSLQSNINRYKNSHLHAQELVLQTKEAFGIHFFNDHILDYYRSFASIKAYDEVFNIYDPLFNEGEKKQLVEMVKALYKNNYNVLYSAKELYIHRNTLLFRLNKLKDTLNIDPIAVAEDREFLNELAYYFSKTKKAE